MSDSENSADESSGVEYRMPEVTSQDRSQVLIDELTTGCKDADDLQQSLVCAICMDRLNKPITLLCQHTYCKECLIKMNDRKCPVCKIRFIIPKEHNRVIDLAVKLFFRESWEANQREEEQRRFIADRRKQLDEELREQLFNQVVNVGLEEFEREALARRRNNDTDDDVAAGVWGTGNTNANIANNLGSAIYGLMNGRTRRFADVYGDPKIFYRIMSTILFYTIMFFGSSFGLTLINLVYSDKVTPILGIANSLFGMVFSGVFYLVCKSLSQYYIELQNRRRPLPRLVNVSAPFNLPPLQNNVLQPYLGGLGGLAMGFPAGAGVSLRDNGAPAQQPPPANAAANAALNAAFASLEETLLNTNGGGGGASGDPTTQQRT